MRLLYSDSPKRFGSAGRPGVNKREADALEVGEVACGKFEAIGGSDAGYLEIGEFFPELMQAKTSLSCDF